MGPAEESYQSALKIFAVLVRENSVSSDWRHNLALVHERIGYLYSVQGKTEEAEESYRQGLKTYQVAIQANQKDPVSYNGKAWLLATCPLAEVRNGPQAVQDAAEA